LYNYVFAACVQYSTPNQSLISYFIRIPYEALVSKAELLELKWPI